MRKEILVSMFLGSSSDLEKMSKGLKLMEDWKLPYRLHILSAHRTPGETEKAIQTDEKDGAKVVIAAAGMAAHLPGVLASKTILPVIGVPLTSSSLNGVDALYSIVQMPGGIPVATMSLDSAGAKNAVIFAAQVLGGKWTEEVKKLREKNRLEVLEKNKLAEEGGYKAFF